jgi:hypothetical protein
MTQDRKYFGMTVQQLGILGALALVACLLFGITGVFALRRSSGLFAKPPESTPTAQLTSTIVLTPTIVSTEIPTPIPYDQLIPTGWTQHKTALVELWLPSDFKNAAPGAVAGVAGNTVFLDQALVSSSNSSIYKTSASVSYEPMTTDSLEEFLDLKLSNIPPEINLAERRKVFINSTEAIRLMFEGHTNNNVDTNDLLFVFQDGSTVWYVKYSAEITDFYEKLSVFEDSAKTFRIVR